MLAPLVGLMLGLGLVTALLQCFAPPLAAPVALLLEPCCHLYTATVQLLAKMPGAPMLAWRQPGAAELAAAALVAAALLAAWPTRRGLAGACLTLCLPFHLGTTTTESNALRLFDVGHGQAALITGPNGRRVLCDCGSGRHPRHAARAVVDAIRGPLGIDVAILTHADADHIAGFEALASRMRITAAVLPAAIVGLPLVRELAARGTQLHPLAPGQSLGLSDGIVVHAPPVSEDATSNEHSLWTIVEQGGLRIVLPADAEGSNLGSALRTLDLRDVDVLVLPHHGRGETAPNQQLLTMCRPRLALASCGEEDDPPLAPLARRDGAQVLTTGEVGTITILLDGSRRIGTAREPRVAVALRGGR